MERRAAQPAPGYSPASRAPSGRTGSPGEDDPGSFLLRAALGFFPLKKRGRRSGRKSKKRS